MATHEPDDPAVPSGTSSRSTRRQKIILAAIGVAGAAAVVVFAEVVFYGLNHWRSSPITGEEPYLYEFNVDLGYKPLPNVEAPAHKSYDGTQLFDVVYRTDALGRRISDTPEANSPAESFILFFGGSFTFGEGVDGDETLPAQVAQLEPDAHVYNYGFSGYGPQQMLAKLQSGTLAEEVPEESGTLVYVFVEDHIRRAIGAFRMWAQWGRHFPYYRLDDDGVLQRDGSFYTGRPRLSAFYDVFKREQILRYFNVDFPLSISKGHVELTAQIIATAHDTFLAQYPSGRFIVLFYPSVVQRPSSLAQLQGRLAERGVQVADFTDLLDLEDPRFYIPHDRHPSADAHHEVAARLVEEMNLDE